MKVRLTRKLADVVDGIDLSNYGVGDVLDLPSPEATLLVAEQWAIAERRSVQGRPPDVERRGAPARDAPTPEDASPTKDR